MASERSFTPSRSFVAVELDASAVTAVTPSPQVAGISTTGPDHRTQPLILDEADDDQSSPTLLPSEVLGSPADSNCTVNNIIDCDGTNKLPTFVDESYCVSVVNDTPSAHATSTSISSNDGTSAANYSKTLTLHSSNGDSYGLLSHGIKKSKRMSLIEREAMFYQEALQRPRMTLLELTQTRMDHEAKAVHNQEVVETMSKIPLNIKSRFRQPGWTKWGHRFLPVIEIAPFDLPEGNEIRDQWFQMLDEVKIIDLYNCMFFY